MKGYPDTTLRTPEPWMAETIPGATIQVGIALLQFSEFDT